MKKFSRYFYFAVFICFFVLGATAFSQSVEKTNLLNYYDLIKKDNNKKASELIFNEMMNSSNPDVFYSGLFKLLYTFYSEDDFDLLKDYSVKLLENEAIASDLQSYNLIQNIIMTDRLTAGDFSEVENIKRKTGWVDYYKITGPFQYNGFEAFAEMEFPSEDKIIRNSNGNVLKSFPVKSARDGEVDLNRLFQRYDAEVYFAKTFLHVKKDGLYNFIICKTGFTEVKIDDTKVMLDKNKSQCFPGLYIVQAELKAGVHKLSIKTAENKRNEVSFGVQILDSNNKPVESGINLKNYMPQKNINFSYKLGYNINKNIKSENEEVRLNNAIIMYVSGLYMSPTNYVIKSISDIKESSDYYSFAQTICASSDFSYENMDYYLKNALRKDPQNARALYRLFSMKQRSGFYTQADEILKKLEKVAPYSISLRLAKINFYTDLQWYYEAEKEISKLRENFSESVALAMEIPLREKQQDYRRLTEIYRMLYSKDNYNEEYAENIINYSRHFTSNDRIINENLKFSNVFYNNMFILNSTANRMKYSERYYSALAVLTNAEKKCPYNAFTYFNFSQVFERLGKNNLSRHYLKKSSGLEPGDRFLKEYHQTIYGKEEPLQKYVSNIDIEELADKADKYNSEPAVMLLDEQIEKVHADGSTTKRVIKAYKIFDPENAESLKQQYFIINAGEDEVVSINSSVSYEGETAGTGSVSYQHLTDPESRLYYDMGAVIVNYPSLKKNAVITLDYTIHSDKGDIYKGSYGTKYYYSTEYRILKMLSSVIAPASKKFIYKIDNTDKIKSSVNNSNGEKIYNFTAENMLPALKEMKMRPSAEITPSVTLTGFKDWTEFYKWYKPLFTNQIVLSDQIKNDIDNLIKDLSTDEEKVKAIYTYITDRIRYVGFEMGIGGIRPRRTDVTYQTKLGDCKDIALLLTAIYNSVGIKSKLALVNTADRGETDKSIAYLGAFNHAICYVDINGGIFLDGTVKKAGIRELVSSDRGVHSLVVDEDGFNFITIDPKKYDPNAVKTENIVELYSNGSASIKRTTYNTGHEAVVNRNSLSEYKRFYNSIIRSWNSLYPGAKVSGLRFLSDKVNVPLTYTYSVSIKNYAVSAAGEIYIPLLLYKYDYYSSYALSSDRYSDVYISKDISYLNKITYKIPKNFTPSIIPESADYEFKGNSVKVKVVYDEDVNEISLEYNIVFKKGIIAAEEYSSFRNFLLNIAAKETEKIVLKPNGAK